jgi:hypothetical protein
MMARQDMGKDCDLPTTCGTRLAYLEAEPCDKSTIIHEVKACLYYLRGNP